MIRTRERRKQHLMKLSYEKQLALEQERLRISNNLHDDLGSGLSALHLRAQVIAQRPEDTTLRDDIQKLADRTRHLVNQIRETIWTTSSEYDTIDNLVTHFQQYAHDFFANTDISVSVKIPAEQSNTPIAGADRREIYLAFKEALHNVLKHSGASHVKIHADLSTKETLTISIADNGNGFEIPPDNPGHGLSSMQTRMQGIGGRCNITSGVHGTVVELVYPIK
jgi:signal transduction histidine kinase